MVQFKFLVFVFFVGLIHSNNGSNILGVFPQQGKSHYIMFEALMKGLAAKGHNVDVISHFPQKKPLPRFTDYSMVGTLPMVQNNVSIMEHLNSRIYDNMVFITEFAGSYICDALLNWPEFDRIYQDAKNKKYDVIITEVFGTDCPLIFGGLETPVVGLSSCYPPGWTPDRFGIIDNPAYIPNAALPYGSNMNFFQKLHTAFVNILMKFMYYYKSTLVTDQKLQQKFGSNIPSTEAMQYNMSLFLINTHHSIFPARSFPPNVREVAGIHLKPPGILSKEWEKVINSGRKGVIFFTMGSMLRIETFPWDVKRALIESFAELPDYTIILKANKSEFGSPIPKNIHFANWIPQGEILCHPKIKAFVSHGGLMGSLEGINCGVPFVGIPFIGDQPLNVQALVSKGMAESLDVYKLTKSNILGALKKVLENPRYAERAKQVQKEFQDRPLSALDEAVWWVEYVIRHKGAPHLKSALADLSWYQIYLFDLLAFLTLILVASVSIIYLLTSSFFKTFNYKKNVEKVKTK